MNDACETDAKALPKYIVKGIKARLSELQFASFPFLGLVITADGKSLSPKCDEAMQLVPKPQRNNKQASKVLFA